MRVLRPCTHCVGSHTAEMDELDELPALGTGEGSARVDVGAARAGWSRAARTNGASAIMVVGGEPYNELEIQVGSSVETRQTLTRCEKLEDLADVAREQRRRRPCCSRAVRVVGAANRRVGDFSS